MKKIERKKMFFSINVNGRVNSLELVERKIVFSNFL